MEAIDQQYAIMSIPTLLRDAVDGITISNPTTSLIQKLIANNIGLIGLGDIIIKLTVSRDVAHELVGHSVWNSCQEDAKIDSDVQFVRPYGLLDASQTIQDGWTALMGDAETSYTQLIGAGWSSSNAKEIMPGCLKTSLMVKGNLQQWRMAFNIWCFNTVPPQIKAIMTDCLNGLKAELPVVFDDMEA